MFGPTLSPAGIPDELLQLLHLSLHLLVVGLPGVHLGRREERGVGAHVGAEQVAVGTQADHHSLQLPVDSTAQRSASFTHVSTHRSE